METFRALPLTFLPMIHRAVRSLSMGWRPLAVITAGVAATTLPLCVHAQNTETASDLPCSIESMRRDPADPTRVLITMQGRSHWKYSGPLASGDVSIMLGEGYVYRFVRQGERMTTENLGRDLPLKMGETVLLDQGAVACRITPQASGTQAELLIDFEMGYTNPPQRRSFRLPVTR